MNRSAGLEPVSVAALALLVLAVPLACPSAAVAGDVRVMTFNIRYGTAPDGPNSWESRRELVLETVKAFVIVNTHFDHAGAKARVESARLVSAEAWALRDAVPAIVMGDFNSPAELTRGRPYMELLSGAGDSTRALVDTYRAVQSSPGPSEGTFNAFQGLIDGARIDWILVTPDVEVLEGDIDRRHRRGSYPSDHFPVTAVLRIPARSQE